MFVIDKHNKITLTKGDTASMFIEIYDLEHNKYNIKADDTITLTVKKNSSQEAAISKTADSAHYIIFDPIDTKSLDVGLYIYDVQLTTATGSIYTIVPKSFFELTEEVS